MKLTNPQLAASSRPLEFKQGYYASKVFQKFTSADKEQQLQEALSLGDPLNDLPLVLEADYFRVAQNRYFIPISVKIPGSEVTLVKKGALQTADFDFVGVVKDTSGKSIANMPQWATLGVRDEIKIELKEADATQLEKRNLQYDTGLTLPPGKYSLHFLARENQTGKMGDVRNLSCCADLSAEKNLKISSVIWSNDRKAVGTAVGAATNDKRATANHPLIQDGQKLVPSITRVFRKIRACSSTSKCTIRAWTIRKRQRRRGSGSAARRAQDLHLAADGSEEAGRRSTGRCAVYLQIPLSKIPTGQYTAQVNVIDENGKKFDFPRNTIMVLPEQTAAATPAPAAPGTPAPAQPNQ